MADQQLLRRIVYVDGNNSARCFARAGPLAGGSRTELLPASGTRDHSQSQYYADAITLFRPNAHAYHYWTGERAEPLSASKRGRAERNSRDSSPATKIL